MFSSRRKKKARNQEKEIEQYPWDDLYQIMTCSFGVAPSEYWKMTPKEVSLHLDFKRNKFIGGIHEDEWDRLDERRAELEQQGYRVL